ncbi:MAG: hypothetical protein ACFFD8_09580 [Candidatus Thorarchaeota archaeon]
MNWFTRYKHIVYAIILGAIIGIPLSFFFGNILWLPLTVGVFALISFFCTSPSDLPPEEEDNLLN